MKDGVKRSFTKFFFRTRLVVIAGWRSPGAFAIPLHWRGARRAGWFLNWLFSHCAALPRLAAEGLLLFCLIKKVTKKSRLGSDVGLTRRNLNGGSARARFALT